MIVRKLSLRLKSLCDDGLSFLRMRGKTAPKMVTFIVIGDRIFMPTTVLTYADFSMGVNPWTIISSAHKAEFVGLLTDKLTTPVRYVFTPMRDDYSQMPKPSFFSSGKVRSWGDLEKGANYSVTKSGGSWRFVSYAKSHGRGLEENAASQIVWNADTDPTHVAAAIYDIVFT